MAALTVPTGCITPTKNAQGHYENVVFNSCVALAGPKQRREARR